MSDVPHCELICERLGFDCETIVASGTSIIALDTPFSLFDGTPFTVFAETFGPHLRFFDSGETLFHALALGIRSFQNRSYQSIQTLISGYGAEVTDEGEIQLLTSASTMATGFAHFISSLLAVSGWLARNAGADLAATGSKILVEETRLYLTALAPGERIIHSSAVFKGISGNDYTFDLQQGDRRIDAISAHQNATSSELRKLVDVRGRPITSDIPITVVIDDRRASSLTKVEREVSILGQFADTWLMSRLVHATARVRVTHH